jgi:hypothetical protein
MSSSTSEIASTSAPDEVSYRDAIPDSVAKAPTEASLVKAELYGTEKEKRLSEFVTNAEATRKTAGAEGFKRSQNMKIEGVVASLLTDGQQVSLVYDILTHATRLKMRL